VSALLPTLATALVALTGDVEPTPPGPPPVPPGGHSVATTDVASGDQRQGIIARYYDPRVSLWVSADPALVRQLHPHIGTTRSLNVYSYAFNNPVIFFDPDGLEPLSWSDPFVILFYDGGGNLSDSKLQEYRADPAVGDVQLGVGFVTVAAGAIAAGLGVAKVLGAELTALGTGAGAGEASEHAFEELQRQVEQPPGSEPSQEEPAPTRTDRGPEKGKRLGEGTARSAKEQADEILKAQERVRKGKSKQIIDRTDKTLQRERTHFRRIRDLRDAEDDFDDD
jgi:RHS repeat-associated protein